MILAQTNLSANPGYSRRCVDSTTTSSSATTASPSLSPSDGTTDPAPGVLAQVNYLIEYYQGCLCVDSVPIPVISQITHLLTEGVSPGVIAYALEETALAPSPSWRYARAIINRCIAEGIQTADQARGRSRPQPKKATQYKQTQQHLYQQREYHDPAPDEVPVWLRETLGK